jgi:hypothetical protein
MPVIRIDTARFTELPVPETLIDVDLEIKILKTPNDKLPTLVRNDDVVTEHGHPPCQFPYRSKTYTLTLCCKARGQSNG